MWWLSGGFDTPFCPKPHWGSVQCFPRTLVLRASCLQQSQLRALGACNLPSFHIMIGTGTPDVAFVSGLLILHRFALLLVEVHTTTCFASAAYWYQCPDLMHVLKLSREKV